MRAFRLLAIGLPLVLGSLLPVGAAQQADAIVQMVQTAGIELSGEGVTATRITLADLKAMPATSVDIAFTSSRGEEKAVYRGVLLWALLEKAGFGASGGHHDELRRTVTVTGGDGYSVLFSGGEMAPLFGARQILVAYERDGAPLPAAKGIRLVVPGDTRGARSVMDVTRITVH